MAKPTHVFVTAAPGREVPMPKRQVAAAGARTLRVKSGTVQRVPYTSYTRRRIARGDLLLVDRAGAAAKNISDAAAPPQVASRHLEGREPARRVTKEAEIEGGGPPATFGDAPPIDGGAVRTAEPLNPSKE